MRSYEVTSSDGVTLRVDAAGDPHSRPIVFVHGYSQSRLCWQRQFESDLIDDYLLVAFDNRGHGDSEKPRDAYDDPSYWANDVRAVLESLDRSEPVLVCWSYGGLIVTDYFAVYGTEEVSGVNYVGAITEKGTADAVQFAGDAFIVLMEGLESCETKESVTTLGEFIELCVNEPLDPIDFHFMLGYNLKTPPHVREALQTRIVDNESVLEEVRIPVLLTHGECDPVVLRAAAEKHADVFPAAKTSFYPDIGHSPFWEAPDRFNTELRAFVERL
ncbi:alpha/beta fold hydrolase [Natronorarus salvus]|uniref:alpha/beta fold hydrolase n=1 Tax=Natronorarus salvus TaxID=3117733 RepID=UPI002F26890A